MAFVVVPYIFERCPSQMSSQFNSNHCSEKVPACQIVTCAIPEFAFIQWSTTSKSMNGLYCLACLARKQVMASEMCVLFFCFQRGFGRLIYLTVHLKVTWRNSMLLVLLLDHFRAGFLYLSALDMHVEICLSGSFIVKPHQWGPLLCSISFQARWVFPKDTKANQNNIMLTLCVWSGCDGTL